MRQSVDVEIPRKYISLCGDFGSQMAADYAAGKYSHSLRAGLMNNEHDIYNRPDILAASKLYEVAAALALNLEPETALRWGFDEGSKGPDSGHDMIFHGWKIDAKGTYSFENKFLLWPLPKNNLWDKKDFDFLLWVRRPPKTLKAKVGGFVQRYRFEKHHHTADSQHPLDEGTWYMDAGELDPIELLLGLMPDADSSH